MGVTHCIGLVEGRHHRQWIAISTDGGRSEKERFCDKYCGHPRTVSAGRWRVVTRRPTDARASDAWPDVPAATHESSARIAHRRPRITVATERRCRDRSGFYEHYWS